MNTFKRLGDIISSNINSLLDRAENPEKMVDFSIRKLEDSRNEIKATIASKKAQKDNLQRKVIEERENMARWAERAHLAVQKGRDDMAREAIAARQEQEKRIKTDEESLKSFDSAINSLETTLLKTDEKLKEMKTKSSELKARARCASERIKAHREIEKSSDSEWLRKIEELNYRIEKLECEADISSPSPEKETTFEEMERDEAIEEELRRIKNA